MPARTKKPRKQAPEARRRGKQNQNTQMRACSAHSPLCAPKKSVRKQARSALRPPVVSDPVVCRAIPYFVQRVPKTLPPLSFQFARQHSAPRHSIVRCPARICNPFGHGPASAAKRPRPAPRRPGPQGRRAGPPRAGGRCSALTALFFRLSSPPWMSGPSMRNICASPPEIAAGYLRRVQGYAPPPAPASARSRVPVRFPR